MQLKDKVVLITGASKGIGRATAVAFAKEGCFLVINYKSDRRAAEEVLQECNAYSDKNMIVKADVADRGQVKAMINKIKKLYRTLDVLVNNAGIFDDNDSPDNIEVFEKIYRQNFLSHVCVTKYALEIMRRGKIVNVSSIHGRLGQGRPGAIAYAAFKAAFENYTKNLAKAVAPEILVNAMAPGRVVTPMWGDLSKQEQRELGRGQLIKRMIEPEEVADAILFLVKNDAMCGEVLTIDGGMSLVTVR